MKLERVRRGDVLILQVHVVEANEDDGITAKVYGSADTTTTWYSAAEVEHMSYLQNLPHPPPEPKTLRFLLGDEVYRTWDKSDRGEVKAISGDKYWVAFGNGLHLTLSATDMVLI